MKPPPIPLPLLCCRHAEVDALPGTGAMEPVVLCRHPEALESAARYGEEDVFCNGMYTACNAYEFVPVDAKERQQ